ncbi:PREDICTED: F-box/kelch-repeat protein At4g19865-like [Camelina sativa]|uniref:F-box/kelch-repeat protein At4g19865-like n=1 Tax=Camelina sativa TaxID=90675 RepID=A0ABM0V168_CAMSA|nr:PREDICTED: F-box/kelch-repeat protein At4g19865-like [Camelina sativa]
MNIQVEPPEKKKKRKKKIKNSWPPLFSLLPDEIVVNCLARISRSYYPTLSVVSKSFHSIISSTELYAARSHLGTTEKCLYVCLSDHKSSRFPQWFTLWINPNRTRRRKKKKTIGQLLVPISSSNFNSLSDSTVVGSELYIIGGPVDKAPSSAVRTLNCGSHTWRDAPSMNVARRNASTCVYNGKIYVMGGCRGSEDESWAEVFDTKTQVWERLPDPGSEIRNCCIYSITEIEGKLNFGSYEEMYAYDTKLCKWESSVHKFGTVARLECMIENVSYSFGSAYLPYGFGDFFVRREFQWSDEKVGYWKKMQGLDSLVEKYLKNGGSSLNRTKLVSCDGKLILLWEGYMKHNPSNRKKIWCAVIVVEKRDGDEVWGNVEWVDVVHTVPISCELWECAVVSV